MKNIFKIKEEVKIPGTDIVLEKGDKIRVLEESLRPIEVTDRSGKIYVKRVPISLINSYRNNEDGAFSQIVSYLYSVTELEIVSFRIL